MSQAIRATSVVVLPLPAGATHSTGPAVPSPPRAGRRSGDRAGRTPKGASTDPRRRRVCHSPAPSRRPIATHRGPTADFRRRTFTKLLTSARRPSPDDAVACASCGCSVALAPNRRNMPMAASSARAPRRRSLVLLAAITLLAALSAAPVASAAPLQGRPEGRVLRRRWHAPGCGRGLCQEGPDATMAGFLKKGIKASGNGLLTQAPPNTGAGWYTLATGAWPGVHGSTNNTFHKSGSAGFATNRTAAFDPNVAPGRDDRPVRRTWRAQGRPGRMGGRTQRQHQGPDDRLPDVPVRSWRRHRLRQPHRHPGATSPRSACSSTRRRPADAGRGWTNVPAPRTARPRSCTSASSTPASTSTASTPTSTTHQRRHHELRPRAVHAGPVKDGNTKVGDLREGEWADVKVQITGSGAPSRARPPACWSRSRR